MTINTLYELAESNGIDIECFVNLPSGSLSVECEDGSCAIALNPLLLQSLSDERIKIAHEMGHCETGSFYNRYSTLDIRQKHENVADHWAIKKLIPKDELLKAIFSGITEPWELAEHFDVTEEFMRKAMEYYETDEAFVAAVAPLRENSW